MAAAVAASEVDVAAAAREALRAGNAADAVVAGVFLSAALNPAVLLGPVQILAAGGGAGILALDGRCRQPGLGAPRPRGYLPEEVIPQPARVAVPALPAGLAAVLGALGKQSLRRALGPAISVAKSVSGERAGLLERLGRKGPTAFWDDAVAGELLELAGRAAGGLLTQDDLLAVRPDLVRCGPSQRAPSAVVRPPWEDDDARDGSEVQIVIAADSNGMTVLACFESPREGLAVPALGLVAPLLAVPVLRGKRRRPPGEPLAAAAPIALHVTRGQVDVALGYSGAADGQARLHAATTIEDAAALAVQIIQAPAQAGRWVALASSRDASRVLASA